MDAEKVPIADLQPGDEFRLSHILPVVTVERIDVYTQGYGRYANVRTQEEPWPIRGGANRKVWRMKRGNDQ
jgi:hypothetical protein